MYRLLGESSAINQTILYYFKKLIYRMNVTQKLKKETIWGKSTIKIVKV